MPHTPRTQIHRRHPALLLSLLVGAITITLALLLGSGSADGRSSKVLGAGGGIPKPLCPKACQVFGHVTGFQIRTAKQKGAYKVREDGHIVAWSISMGEPSKDERPFFEDVLRDQTSNRFGGRPVANLSVLKKVGTGRFKLAKQSPVVELQSNLNEKPIFTLDKPLKVKKGSTVALSTPTWVPNFAVLNGADATQTLWRASRDPERCENEDVNGDGEIKGEKEIANLTSKSKSHAKKGSTRKYGCVYSQAQILYWAYFVPEGDKKKK